MKRYEVEECFHCSLPGSVRESVHGQYVETAEVQPRDSRIEALEQSLEAVTEAFAMLHTCHWDVDDVQPEEEEERDEQRQIIDAARAVLKEGK